MQPYIGELTGTASLLVAVVTASAEPAPTTADAAPQANTIRKELSILALHSLDRARHARSVRGLNGCYRRCVGCVWG
ncbi:hypothetical protein [Aeromicrobium sp. JJY06]|uniref:hypothetical protein n=1 Tax=Aeromicrobium sp. JJY06 TaxID=3373478 RepID=UPI00376EAB48